MCDSEHGSSLSGCGSSGEGSYSSLGRVGTSFPQSALSGVVLVA